MKFVIGKRDGFNQEGNLDATVTPVTKEKFTAPKPGLEEVYFAWRTVSNVTWYA